jgi:UDPglucose 6-dehydrogenase
MARILVVGLGYVGLMSSIGLARLGNSVIGIDIDSKRVEELRNGTVPFYEPGLEDLLVTLTKAKAVSWVDNYEEVRRQNFDFCFVCVATPSTSSGSADISMIEEALGRLEAVVGAGCVIVIRSTVPIGTSDRHFSTLNLFKSKEVQLAYNPEFLSEGAAVKGFFSPDRIVVGANNETTAMSVLSLYETLDAPSLICDLTSAETVKHASNAFLALRLSFVNELAMLCKATGANYRSVSVGIGLDSRIGKEFLSPGPGWGGSCFPKDALELVSTASKLGTPMTTIQAAIQSNKTHLANASELITATLGGNLNGKTISVWGLSFKAGTDDVRESPAVAIASNLISRGAKIKAYDPVAKAPESLNVYQDQTAIAACANSSALVVLTDWPEFSTVEPGEVKKVMSQDAYVFDFRSVLDQQSWQSQFKGFWKISD